MAIKGNTRITIDIPTIDHKKLKMLAAYHGKTMREVFIEIVERGLEHYQECLHDHTPNATTKRAIASIQAKKGLKTAASVEDLFKQLNK